MISTDTFKCEGPLVSPDTNVLYIVNNYMAGADCVSTGSSTQDVCGIIRDGRHNWIKNLIAWFPSILVLTPTRLQPVLDACMIQYPAHHRIDQIMHGLRLIVKSGACRQDDHTQARQLQHVFKVNA